MRPITDVLRDVRRGAAVDEATEQLAEVVRGVMETGSKGSLTVKLTVELNGKGGNQIVFGTEIKSNVPRAKLPDALFFADTDGSLLREDPTQHMMFAEVVDKETGEVTRRRKGE